MEPVSDQLVSLGGTGHWYHLAERILNNLDAARTSVWSIENTDMLHIVFQEKESIENMDGFCRMLTAAVLSGGMFKAVSFSYLSSRLRTSIPTGEVVWLDNIYSLHMIDKSEDSKLAFTKDSNALEKFDLKSTKPLSGCYQPVYNGHWVPFKDKSSWFSRDPQSFYSFRESVSNFCDIPEFKNDHSEAVPKVTKHEDLIDDFQTYTGTRKDKMMTELAAHGTYVPAYAAASPHKRVMIYQRDSSRSIVNLESMMDRVKLNLNGEECLHRRRLDNESKEVAASCQWQVEAITHDRERPPCELVSDVAQSDVFLTAHGFQSVLQLFQPLTSTLAEIHPYHYIKPTVYGLINVALRIELTISRSYMFEESEPPNTWLGWLFRDVLTYDTPGCMSKGWCRYLARLQDVSASEEFTDRVTTYVKKALI